MVYLKLREFKGGCVWFQTEGEGSHSVLELGDPLMLTMLLGCLVKNEWD